MALLCDYFAAPSEADAALTVEWDGGPSRPPEGQPAYEVISLGIEPVVLMGQLEALLTNRSLADVRAEPGHDPVAIRGGGERLVFPVGERLEEALASLDQARIPEVAAKWAEAKEFWGRVAPADLIQPISQLVSLSQDARSQSRHVYCWMSV